MRIYINADNQNIAYPDSKVHGANIVDRKIFCNMLTQRSFYA